jgi:hypothetical protein
MHLCSKRLLEEAVGLVEENRPSCEHKRHEDADDHLETDAVVAAGEEEMVVDVVEIVEVAVASRKDINWICDNEAINITLELLTNGNMRDS